MTVPHTPLLPPLAEGMIVIIQLPQQQQQLTQLRLPLQLQYAQPMMTVQYQAKPVRTEDVCLQYAVLTMTVPYLAKPVRIEDVCPQYAQPMLTVQYLDKPVGTE